MQQFLFLRGNETVEVYLPPPEVEVIQGVAWGRADVLFTAAYWLTQYWMTDDLQSPPSHRLGASFEEEVAACVLGGYGIPAEVGLAAFECLRQSGLLASKTSASEIAECLRQPLKVQGRLVTYRFWSQKANYLARILQILGTQAMPMGNGRELRNTLMALPGIGPKTASWIVRNWLSSDDVAILDVHIVRAGLLMGLYESNHRVERHYRLMERRFLDLAAAFEVPAASLDALIWNRMRHSPKLISKMLNNAPQTPANEEISRFQSKPGLLQLA